MTPTEPTKPSEPVRDRTPLGTAAAGSAPPPPKPRTPRPFRVEKHQTGTENTPSCNPNFRPGPGER